VHRNDTPVIRPAGPADMKAIEEISSLTWEGHDYLHEVAGDWMKSSGFVVAELNGRVVGTGRMAPMPGGVLWLEGLRVHPDFQGKGYGRLISTWLVEKGRRMIASGESKAMEFSTYMDNNRSISISGKQGFRLVDSFYILYRECDVTLLGAGIPVSRFEPSIDDFSGYLDHIPCGWKLPRHIPDSIPWLIGRCSFYRTSDGTAFYDGGECIFSPAGMMSGSLDSLFDGIDTVVLSHGREYCEMVIHHSREDLVTAAKERGYLFWDETDSPNLLVFRLDQVRSS
jgi:GNAT superfamily N-acetyltransferase